MNDCPNAEMRDQLCDVVHRTMSDADCRRVEEHIATCPECAAEIALLRRAHAVLTRRVPSVNTASIVAALPKRRASRVPSFGTWRIAATIAVIAVGAASFSIATRDGTSGSDSAASALPTASADAETFSFAGRLASLDEDDLEQLLAEIDEFDGVTPVEPRAVLPVPTWDGGTQ